MSLELFEIHKFITPDDGDSRWPAILATRLRVTTRFHSPLPPGDVEELTVFNIVRKNITNKGYDELVYFGNVDDVKRFNKSPRLLTEVNIDEALLANPAWTVRDLLDYADGGGRLPKYD